MTRTVGPDPAEELLMAIMTYTDLSASRAACTGQCVVDPALRAHHDRLLRVEHDTDELVELMELAVTWGELEYGDEPVIGPHAWTEFAAAHVWADPERAARIFSLAVDVAARCPVPPAR